MGENTPACHERGRGNHQTNDIQKCFLEHSVTERPGAGLARAGTMDDLYCGSANTVSVPPRAV